MHRLFNKLYVGKRILGQFFKCINHWGLKYDFNLNVIEFPFPFLFLLSTSPMSPFLTPSQIYEHFFFTY